MHKQSIENHKNVIYDYLNDQNKKIEDSEEFNDEFDGVFSKQFYLMFNDISNTNWKF